MPSDVWRNHPQAPPFFAKSGLGQEAFIKRPLCGKFEEKQFHIQAKQHSFIIGNSSYLAAMRAAIFA